MQLSPRKQVNLAALCMAILWLAGCVQNKTVFTIESRSPDSLRLTFLNAPGEYTSLADIAISAEGNFISKYKYILDSTPCATNVNWSDEKAISENLQLQLTNDGPYYLCGVGIDSDGVVQKPATQISFFKDATAPTPPTNVDDGSLPGSFSVSPAFSFTAGSDDGSGVLAAQVRVFDITANQAISQWTDIVAQQRIENLSLQLGHNYKTQFRMIDKAGITSEVVDGDGWDLSQLNAVISVTTPNDNFYVNLANQSSFSISGTCNKDGLAVSVLINGAITESSLCTSGAFNKNLNLTSVADGPLSLSFTLPDGNGGSSTPVILTGSKDTIAPGFNILTPAANSWINNSTKANFPMTGSATEAQGRLTVKIGATTIVTSDLTTTNWSQSLDYSSYADGPLSLVFRYTDLAGNTTGDIPFSLRKDILPPTAPANLIVPGSYASINSSPTLNWDASSDTLSGLESYELKVGSTSGGDQNLPWTPIGSSNSYQKINLILATNSFYFPSLRAKDNAGNYSAEVNGTSWQALAPPYIDLKLRMSGGFTGGSINAIAIDPNGNIFVAGSFANDNANSNDVKDFNGAPLLGNSASVAGYSFIAKINSAGQQDWIKLSQSGGIASIAADSQGSVVFGGAVSPDSSASAGLDFNGNSIPAHRASNSEIFLGKLNSSGTQVFFKTAGGPANADSFYQVATDSQNNIIVAAILWFNGDSGDKLFDGNGTNGGAFGGLYDPWLIKTDPNGNTIWSRNIKSASMLDGYARICVLSDDSVAVTAGIRNNNLNGQSALDFSGAPLPGATSTLEYDVFAAKILANGNQSWIRTAGGTARDLPYSIACRGSDVFVGFSGIVSNPDATGMKDFAGNSLTARHGSIGNNGDIFVAKLNTSGTQQWIKQAGSTLSETVDPYNSTNPMATDSSGNVYIARSFSNDIINSNQFMDFSGALLGGLAAIASNDIYIAKLNGTDGNQTYIKRLGGLGDDLTTSITVSGDGYAYLSGKVSNNLGDSNLIKDFSGVPILGFGSSVFDIGVAYLVP
jgi:hypothetical protein